MAKYLIKWDAGYGESYEVVDADNQAEADKQAYQAWKEEAENNSNYSANVLTQDDCDNYGIDPEEHGLPPLEYDD